MHDAICNIAMETVERNTVWQTEAVVSIAVDTTLRHVVGWLYNEGEDELAELLVVHGELR